MSYAVQPTLTIPALDVAIILLYMSGILTIGLLSVPDQNHGQRFFSRRTIAVMAISRCGSVCFQHFDHPPGWTYGVWLQ